MCSPPTRPGRRTRPRPCPTRNRHRSGRRMTALSVSPPLRGVTAAPRLPHPLMVMPNLLPPRQRTMVTLNLPPRLRRAMAMQNPRHLPLRITAAQNPRHPPQQVTAMPNPLPRQLLRHRLQLPRKQACASAGLRARPGAKRRIRISIRHPAFE